MHSFTLKRKSTNESDVLKSYRNMIDDLEQQFDWFNVHSFMPGFVASFTNVIYDHWENGIDKFKFSSGNTFELPVHIAYEMLKLAGCNVERYGFIEVWESVDADGNLSQNKI